MHEGMVHTLKEIHRVLKPSGTLIDIRPHFNNDVVNVVLSVATLRAGEIDSSSDVIDKHRADDTIKQAVQDGLFSLEYDETFDFIIDFDTVADLRDYRKSLNRSKLSDAVLARAEALTTDETDDFSIQLHRLMQIARYRKK
jgi:hypothetical protein